VSSICQISAQIASCLHEQQTTKHDPPTCLYWWHRGPDIITYRVFCQKLLSSYRAESSFSLILPSLHKTQMITHIRPACFVPLSRWIQQHPSWLRSSHSHIIYRHSTQQHHALSAANQVPLPVILYWATFAPLPLCWNVTMYSILPTVENHPNWQLHADILNHPRSTKTCILDTLFG